MRELLIRSFQTIQRISFSGLQDAELGLVQMIEEVIDGDGFIAALTNDEFAQVVVISSIIDEVLEPKVIVEIVIISAAAMNGIKRG